MDDARLVGPSSASAICFAIGNASSGGIGPSAIRSANVGPSTSSNTNARTPSDSSQTVDRADMRMIQRGKSLRFTFEASEAVRIGSECLGQDLERDVAIQLRIARAIHLAHAARPEQAQDFVCAKPCTRRQSHEALLILAT